MTIDAKTERILREMCLRGPVEYADMVSILERYKPPTEPVDFAAYVINARWRCASNEDAARLAIKKLQAEEDRRLDIVEQFRGHPCEQQVREALGRKEPQ